MSMIKRLIVSHRTPRYILDRLRVKNFERLHPDVPWLTKAMVEILSDWLQSSDRGVEFGSGRSTWWFARRVAELVSVEHHKGWYEKVRRELDESDLTHVAYYLREPTEYVEVVSGIRDESLAFALVDGILRDRCALAVLPKLRRGGIVIVDNVNWYLPSASRAPASIAPGQSPVSVEWQQFQETVGEWRYIWTSNGVTDTAFWVKP